MIKIRLPEYVSPRNKWRKSIYRALITKIGKSRLDKKNEFFELEIVLYLTGRRVFMHDIDNRLKDIMDALQGRLGEQKDKHSFHRFIGNDSNIFKVIIIKRNPPKQSKGLGHLVIKKFKKIRV